MPDGSRQEIRLIAAHQATQQTQQRRRTTRPQHPKNGARHNEKLLAAPAGRLFFQRQIHGQPDYQRHAQFQTDHQPRHRTRLPLLAFGSDDATTSYTDLIVPSVIAYCCSHSITAADVLSLRTITRPLRGKKTTLRG